MMRNSISQEDIDFYRKYGFVRIRSLLDEQEVKRLKTAQDEAITKRNGFRFPPKDRYGREQESHDLMFVQRLNIWRDCHSMKEFALNENIAKIAADLAGVDVLRLWNDGAFRKAPWANPTLWHFDVAYWGFNASNGISVWICLDNADASNGGVHFMPGSHLEVQPDKLQFDEKCVAGLFDLPKYQQYKHRQPVCLPLRAGDCTFHNGLMLHGSGTNMTPYERDAWTCCFMPDGSRFNGNQNVLPDDYFSQLSIGDLLNNDDVNPVVYRR